MNKPKILDLFCGCGGLSLGFEKAGFEVALALDVWNDAIKTYNKNHSNSVGICKDVHELENEFLKKFSEEENIVGVIGGPPCQGYSTVGTRDVNDPRNHLYLEYCRIVEVINPQFFVIENVKGLLTLNKGMFKEDIIERFSRLGYNISFKVLNAADYGVPQNRQRVFFVGIKEDVFEFPQEKNLKVSTLEALSDLPYLDNRKEYLSVYSYSDKGKLTEYQKLMRKDSLMIYNHNETKHTEQTKNIISMIKDGGKISDLPEEYWGVRKYNKAFQRMNSKEPSHTIDTGHRNYFHYKENRVPSVRECARIQSFPDNFIFYGSKTSQYKQVGNAVPPLLAEQIALQIKKYLKR
ncbi:Modification methylase BspRI [Clostridium perfringens]|uniref:DNA cytosine methyltransferase n=1 Tax=Clostridium perfringens TaxID=1502 RepID=UPI0021AC6CBB|nr:DNA cytosine methyltransferase [Clostridium perfringens]EJT5939206.1 DNA cytosine methyltransferase [Clostridium perfringens]EJT6471145.1 DNA cytosine methyltransferase [Clostridium perfringens]ELC8347309.1 DNA cytosine methyltransferase [Clostridium perfringens]MDG6880062.1 Modification methylase BspRI [Clostridium perfringens]MDM0451030.1 DNA cytosine methyltransferase [Clostridium perfringens]